MAKELKLAVELKDGQVRVLGDHGEGEKVLSMVDISESLEFGVAATPTTLDDAGVKIAQPVLKGVTKRWELLDKDAEVKPAVEASEEAPGGNPAPA